MYQGTRFLVTGETLTHQKKKEIEAAGAVAIPVYGFRGGGYSPGCEKTHSSDESDHCHIYKDTTAIITHRHNVPHFDRVVDSFLFDSSLRISQVASQCWDGGLRDCLHKAD